MCVRSLGDLGWFGCVAMFHPPTKTGEIGHAGATIGEGVNSPIGR